MGVTRFLIIFGIVLIVIGILWPLLTKIGLGKLPGDIVIERGRIRIYIPLATAVIVSLVLSAILSLAGRL
jgi:hypothetical protein